MLSDNRKEIFVGKQSEKGNAIELVIIGVLALGIIGLIVWRFVDNNKPSVDTNTNSQTSLDEQITDAQREENRTYYVVLNDWGVRFKTTTTEQIQYQMRDSSSGAYDFTTATAKSISDCSNSWLWSIDRHSTKDEVMNGLILNNGNKIGDYYYYSYHTQEMCARSSSDQAVIEQQIKIVEDLINTIEAKP